MNNKTFNSIYSAIKAAGMNTKSSEIVKISESNRMVTVKSGATTKTIKY